YPKAVTRCSPYFPEVQGPQLQIGDAAGKTFSGLPEQFNGCRAKQQEATGSQTPLATLVDQPPQGLEQFRHTLDFVQDDQLVFMPGQVMRSIRKFFPISRVLQIQIQARLLPGDLLSQSGFARLAWPEQGHGGELGQP